jgi:hypothetical protein
MIRNKIYLLPAPLTGNCDTGKHCCKAKMPTAKCPPEKHPVTGRRLPDAAALKQFRYFDSWFNHTNEPGQKIDKWRQLFRADLCSKPWVKQWFGSAKKRFRKLYMCFKSTRLNSDFGMEVIEKRLYLPEIFRKLPGLAEPYRIIDRITHAWMPMNRRSESEHVFITLAQKLPYTDVGRIHQTEAGRKPLEKAQISARNEISLLPTGEVRRWSPGRVAKWVVRKTGKLLSDALILPKHDTADKVHAIGKRKICWVANFWKLSGLTLKLPRDGTRKLYRHGIDLMDSGRNGYNPNGGNAIFHSEGIFKKPRDGTTRSQMCELHKMARDGTRLTLPGRWSKLLHYGNVNTTGVRIRYGPDFGARWHLFSNANRPRSDGETDVPNYRYAFLRRSKKACIHVCHAFYRYCLKVILISDGDKIRKILSRWRTATQVNMSFRTAVPELPACGFWKAATLQSVIGLFDTSQTYNLGFIHPVENRFQGNAKSYLYIGHQKKENE